MAQGIRQLATSLRNFAFDCISRLLMLKMQVDISVTRIPPTIARIHWMVGGERNVPLLNQMSE